MKKTILRILISIILFSLSAGMVVSMIGLVLRWNKSSQFSDALFWVGVIMIIIGVISFQGYRQRTIDRLPLYLDPVKLSNLWEADTFRGKYLITFFGICGLLLLGLSFLVSILF
jgi:hypothetical protein